MIRRRSAGRSTAGALGAGTVVQVFVLGIDPGISRCGYSVVEQEARTPRARAIGVLRTPADDPLPKRLADLQRELRELIA